jgi:hypothetical integral membrane protein (TIGR02206 family)
MTPATPPPFVPFGLAHVLALVAVGALALALPALVRARPATGPLVRVAIALGIVLLLGFEFRTGADEGWLTWRMMLPLELCDAALVLAVATLLRPRPAAAELLYFWASTGSVLAMLTPDLPWGFPRWEFVVFFGLHGLVLAAATVLVFGLGLHPRPGAPRRAFLLTATWTAFVGTMDRLLDANYMFLRHKPGVPTLLDWMGPWPVYIVVGAVLAFLLFHVLALPFRREWREVRTGRPAGGG